MSAVGEAARPTRLGRYELITRIGQGGMAEVQLALQRGPAGFEKLVVVKLVHDSLASQKSFVDMLLDEARVAALVKHPNVVDIYDLGQADGRYFIAMEYLEGEPLLGVLRAGREGKRLDPLSTGRLIADTAEGLDAAHELRSMSGERLELVHHDISLGNIVVLYTGQVKLVDFGVAKASTAGKTKVQGKFSYMAPEKLRGDSGDRRSDIFSLGCVMWEALTLKRLFRGGNDAETMKQVLETTIQPPSKVNGDVPPEYDAIVMRALDRNPARRQKTAKELAVELEEMLRKRGYGAKNDRIAKYMQETFKSHIDARKKLVQEVVSKGSASAEVLDAAFNTDPVLAAGSPVSPGGAAGAEFSAKYRRLTPPPGVPAPANAWADSSNATQISAPPVFDGIDDDDKATVLVPTKAGVDPLASRSSATSSKPSLPMPTRAKPPTAAPAVAPAPPVAPKRAVTATEIDAQPIGVLEAAAAASAPITADLDAVPAHRPAASIFADRKKRLYIAAGAGAVLLLLVIVLVASGGGGDKKNTASEGSSALVVNSGSGDGEPDDGSADVEPDVGSAAEPVIDIDVPPDTGSATDKATDKTTDKATDKTTDKATDKTTDKATDKTTDKTTDKATDKSNDKVTDKSNDRPPPPRIDVKETVQEGLRAFVRGDARGALALLQKARAAKPGYAPTYRVLGNVYKKLGDNTNAKKSLQRYLALAPKARDADTVREEIKKL